MDLFSSNGTQQSLVKRLLAIWKLSDCHGVTYFKEGDKVKFTGFQQYCIIISDSTAKVLYAPTKPILSSLDIAFDQAASVQVGIIPFVVALYAQQPELAHLAPSLYACKLNLVPCLIFTIFVSIQLVKLFGLSPITTTASFHNTELLSPCSTTRCSIAISRPLR
ncbi:hypothetical protein BDR06DRAFT_1020339 [Suillus hirtellus]|nr:hypothetical protein BDR06DRAFT_1020339 [Suillus hirtellus]